MITPLISNQTWLSFPISTRVRIREIFEIPRSGHVEVFGDKVLCDGTMAEDFLHLTIEKMQKYLSTDETDFFRLLTLVVESIEHPDLFDLDTTVGQDTPKIKTLEGTVISISPNNITIMPGEDNTLRQNISAELTNKPKKHVKKGKKK